MKKRIRIEKSPISKVILAYTFDNLSVCLSTLVLYFIILFSIFHSFFSYTDLKNNINNTYEQYNLNLGSNEGYQTYENVLQEFYFNQFPSEITKEYNETYSKEYTIYHIYNVVVLSLPEEPTTSNYKTDLYHYKSNDDGSFLVDEVGEKEVGSGSYYIRSMNDLFYNSYSKLKTLLNKYYSTNNYQLNNEVLTIYKYEFISRLVSFLLSWIILYILIPCLSKNKTTIFEKKFKICRVNKKNGYLINNYKLIVRSVILLLVPGIGIVFFNKYTLIILGIGFYLLNGLLIVLSKKNEDLGDKILRIEVASTPQSLICKNKEEQEKIENNIENKKITDEDFLNKLQNIK